jgi:hypothetical protein
VTNWLAKAGMNVRHAMTVVLACVLCGWLLQSLVPAAQAAGPTANWRPGPGARGDDTFDGYIDAPTAGAQLSGQGALQLAGWFVDTSAQGWAGADDVEIFLGLMNDGGVPVGHAFIAEPRPDVAAALGNPYWSASGWSALVPQSALADGANLLTVYVHAPEKGWWFKQLSVSRPTRAPSASSQGARAAAPGFDLSYPECGGAVPSPIAFGIVGVNGGRAFTPNPCLASEYVWALSAGSPTQPHLSFYLNTGNPGPDSSTHWPLAGTQRPRACDGTASDACAYDYGWFAAQDSVDRARLVAGGLATQVPWWLDVEVENSWSSNQMNNSADLQGAVDALRANGIGLVGVYSLAAEWEQLIGFGPQNTPFAQLPNWRPGATQPSEAGLWCERTVTGGHVQYVQYPLGQLDANSPCT